ncbi:type II secretion system protein [Candidatus Hydrogenosomobacter endosymbioticus]|uniref:Prepilin-type N-terminal cleavage/methylation domain-containing protein n=1 Tax=Candidatus Hydrogenosomobacter endosymbioticus TaxID=2558174 RepID=A0ABN6L3N2_9PROT|nr:hypothetical protein [Candidatus Hydrogenosomobacter endosymbioticus]BDB96524.1 hypothetical protein HYD_6570 [Candidatus Hydrogenosomobacter endosymbioticus]
MCDSGISLIETIIVLVIVGIFLGCAFKGMEFIEQARLQKVVTQIESYMAAVNAFKETYGYLPGDFPNAKSTWNKSDVEDGDGDGIIGGALFEKGKDASLFWSHLSCAGFIQGVDKKTDGIVYPSSALGGCFSVKYNPAEGMEGHWLVLGQESKGGAEGGLLTPAEAKFIEKKFGSADAMSGSFQVRKGSGVDIEFVKNGQYDTSIKKKICVIYVFLSN